MGAQASSKLERSCKKIHTIRARKLLRVPEHYITAVIEIAVHREIRPVTAKTLAGYCKLS
jgi:hypothetical protein